MAGRGELVIKVPNHKKIYFVSDQHFGMHGKQSTEQREKVFVQWLSSIQKDACALFLLGDLFDFWFEYKQVVPKGFVRVLGKLAELSDKGIQIYFFIGNHDLWMKDYLKKEIGAVVFSRPQVFKINEKKLFIAHGDGLGPGDKGYKRLKKLFTNPVAKKLFYILHPDFAIWLGKTISNKNKYLSGEKDKNFYGEQEWLVQYANKKLENAYYDYFIFGHRHLPLEIQLKNKKSIYINTGDWIDYYTYAIFQEQTIQLERYIF